MPWSRGGYYQPQKTEPQGPDYGKLIFWLLLTLFVILPLLVSLLYWLTTL